jgi:tetratricopeptide (TPR) repeat protein
MLKQMNRFIPLAGFLITLASCNGPQSDKSEQEVNASRDSIQIDSATQLIRENPQNALLYSNRADIYLKQGNLAGAINDLSIANRIDSLNPDYYIKLADFYFQLGRSETINKLLLKGNTLIPYNKEILYRLGNLYFYIQNYKNALIYLDKATTVDPFFAQAVFTKGLVFKEIGNRTKAITCFETAVKQDPHYYDAYMQLGLLFAAQNNPKAVDYYNNALLIMPNSYEALYGKALFYQQTKNLDKAVETYRYMLDEVSNDFPAVHFNLGTIEMDYYSNYYRAISYFDSALMFKPIFPEALCNRAFCFEKSGKNSEARTDYTKALEQSPNYKLAVDGLNRLDK